MLHLKKKRLSSADRTSTSTKNSTPAPKPTFKKACDVTPSISSATNPNASKNASTILDDTACDTVTSAAAATETAACVDAVAADAAAVDAAAVDAASKEATKENKHESVVLLMLTICLRCFCRLSNTIYTV